MKTRMRTKTMLLCTALFILHSMLFIPEASAQVEVSYASAPRHVEIGGIAVEGIEGYEDFVVIGLSGLSVGQEIDIPGAEVTEAVKRYWKH